MTLDTPHTVLREAFTATTKDALNNLVGAWAEPVEVGVHGWAPASADTVPAEQGRNAVKRDTDLLAPIGTVSGPRDHWTLDGTLFEQVGHAEDFSHGPFRYRGGLRINLVRVEG